MTRKIVLSFSMIVFLLAACSAPTPTPTPVPPTATAIPTATATAIPPTATPTLVPPTATPRPTDTPVLTTGRVEGRVFRSDSDKSIANAAVELNDATLDVRDPKFKVSEATTDVQGRYSFAGVKPGKYSLSVTWSFQNQSDSPCPVAVAGSFSLASFTRDGWFALVSAPPNVGGLVLIATGVSYKFDVAPGEVSLRNIDLKCK